MNKKGQVYFGFFRVVLKGKLTLLRFRNLYFAKKPDGGVFQVTKGFDELDNGKLRPDYRGLGLLKANMTDCPSITSGYIETEYNANRYLGLFRKYNNCIGAPLYEPKPIVIKPHLDWGIQFSTSMVNLTMLTPLTQVKFDPTISIGGGIFASVFVPKVNEKVRLMLEATYRYYKGYQYVDLNTIKYDFFVDYSYLNVPIAVRYSFGHLFVDVGIQNQIIVNQDLRWRTEDLQQGSVYTEDQPIESFRSLSYGLLAGVGVKVKAFDHPLCALVRFSQVKSPTHPNTPTFQTLDFSLSFQLSRN
ncbi:MAG: hypothetical protein JST14_05680 [Bacteroidetes bacterium]|nr:hypothetical protein [Bacteroidota bacterium]